MLRTKASTYAVLAVAEIARRQASRAGGVQAGEIARCIGLPAAYAAKVLTQLARANILRSDRGPRGGFRLVNSPELIPLLDVIEAVDGTIVAEVALMDWEGEGQQTLRRLDEVFGEIIERVRGALRRETIADVLRSGSPAPALVPTS